MVGLRNKLFALVIDNDYTSNAIEQATLHSFGVEAFGVKDGRIALELLARGYTFDLILIDLYLPVVNGMEITRQIRAMGVQTKILAVTASAYERVGEAFLNAGAEWFFEKPMNIDLLALILEELDDAADDD